MLLIHKTLKKTIISSLLICSCLSAIGQKVDALGRLRANAVMTAVPFLMIGPDSHLGGMGEVGVAIPNDLNAQFWNPAKYVFSPNTVVYPYLIVWLFGLGLNDINLAYLSGYYKITKMDAISMSLR